ncbi:MAG: MBOAT family protein [Bacteroides sp.]|nr:MBOAT family protein [Roseburia sp.]MCM1346983.1 MBOAT family protein [Bacteroides sp.]MCM1421819.1 MBOAT family protein [Bacteroides sp.]
MWSIDWQRVLEQLSYMPQQPMIFSSGIFLFLFLGFSFVYWCLGRRDTLRLLFVTAFSYYFYYKSSGMYLVLLALVTTTDFFIARAIAADSEERAGARKDGHSAAQRLLLLLSMVVDLGLLCYFKYTNFFGEMLAPLWNGTFEPLDIFLPVGISFFTFQSMSYTIDVYRGNLKPLDRWLDYAFYVSFFPQLVAGPIVRARDFIPQIRRPLVVSREMFGSGVFFIVGGLFKKAVISDYISVNFVERVFAQPDLYSGLENLLAVYGYAMQIYCDFSGYSDMAIGIALLLGFEFPMNFNSPYKSASITEFWRRWHISLSSWLKDYLYISLGGNQHGKLRQYLNLVITMLLGGLWHGASLNFIAWGGLHGVALALDKVKNAVLRRPKDYCSRGMRRVWEVLLTFHFVCFCWIFFRNTTFEGSWTMINQIFTHFQPQIFGQWIESYWAVGSLMLLGYALHFLPSSLSFSVRRMVIRMPLICQALLIVVVIFIVIQIKSSDVQPFIYFQF